MIDLNSLNLPFIGFLNLVIGGTNPTDTEYFWNGPLKQRLLLKFPMVPPNVEDEPSTHYTHTSPTLALHTHTHMAAYTLTITT